MSCGVSRDQVKQSLYELTSSDIEGELRPNKLLEIFLENDFYEKTPSRDDGDCLSNKIAGIDPSRKFMTLFPETLKIIELNHTKNTLKDSIVKARKSVGIIMKAIYDYKEQYNGPSFRRPVIGGKRYLAPVKLKEGD